MSEKAEKAWPPTCPLCGNAIKSDLECQSGGPVPDGCILSMYGIKDILRKLFKSRKEQ